MLQRTIDFGKIDYNGCGRKINPVEVEINLRESSKNGKPVFSAMAVVYNQTKTDCVAAGQCLDSIAKRLLGNKQYMEIYRLWRLYHLNDMHAGTPEQETALHNAGIKGCDEACEYLKNIDLYEVEYDGKPYKYGHGWLYYEIPESDLEKIKALFA